MPFRLKLRRTRRYNVLSKNYFVTRIRLLDGNVIECTLSVESTGQECLEAVAQRLELREVRLSRDDATPSHDVSMLWKFAASDCTFVCTSSVGGAVPRPLTCWFEGFSPLPC